MPRGIDYQTDTPVLTDYVWFWSNATGRLRKTTVQSLLSYVQFEEVLLLGYNNPAGLPIGSNVWTDVPWNTVIEAGGEFSGVSASSTITIPETGRYQLMFTALVTPLSGTQSISYRFVVNGSPMFGAGFCRAHSIEANLPCVGHAVQLNQGDTVKAQCLIGASSGVIGFSSTPVQNYVSVRRVG